MTYLNSSDWLCNHMGYQSKWGGRLSWSKHVAGCQCRAMANPAVAFLRPCLRPACSFAKALHWFCGVVQDKTLLVAYVLYALSVYVQFQLQCSHVALFWTDIFRGGFAGFVSLFMIFLPWRWCISGRHLKRPTACWYQEMPHICPSGEQGLQLIGFSTSWQDEEAVEPLLHDGPTQIFYSNWAAEVYCMYLIHKY